MRQRPRPNLDSMPPPAHAVGGPGEVVDPGVDWRAHFASVARRPWWLVVCVLVALLLAMVMLRRATPVYSTHTEIKYESSSMQLVEFAGLAEGATLPNEMETQIEMVRSPRIMRRVSEALGLQPPGTRTGDAAPADAEPGLVEKLVAMKNDFSRWLVTYDIVPMDPAVLAQQRTDEWLARNLRVTQVGNTRIIRIQFSDELRDRASRVADEFARQYILSLQEEKRRKFEEATQWFDGQLRDAKQRLEGAEVALHEYKGKNDIRVLEQNFQIAQDTMKSISNGIQEALNRMEVLKSRRQVAEDPALRHALLAEDARSRPLVDRMRQIELDRVRLIMENTENHPEVVKATREVQVIQNQLLTAGQELVSDLEADQRIQQINLESLRDRLTRQEELVESIQSEMIQFRVLEREVESSRELYASLLDRSKQVAVTSEMGGAAVTILRPAQLPEFPSSPKILRTLALFMVFGFCAGIAIILLAEKLDRSIKDPRVVEMQLGLATLGTIPFLRDGRGGLLGGKSKGPLLTHFDPASNEAESFRLLRTALQYSRGDKPPQVLLLTSSHPQEGKSTLAANLAISYAQRGDRVILVDCDLKRPTVHRLFEWARSPGLTDILTGQKSLEEVLHPAPVENLDILTAGPSTPSPSDLLESRTMNDLVRTLRERYAIVILDSAPLAGMVDSLVLSQATDGVCLVVNRGTTPYEALGKVVERLDQMDAPVLGVVYNCRSRNAQTMADGAMAPYGYSTAYPARTSE